MSRSAGGDIWASLVDEVAAAQPWSVWDVLAQRLGRRPPVLPVPVLLSAAGEAVPLTDPDAAGRCAKCGAYCPACAPPPPDGWKVLVAADRPRGAADTGALRSALSALEPPQDGRRISPVPRNDAGRRPRRIDRGDA